MEISVRKAALSDYEEVLRIMSQVQDMHVALRPDVYKPNNQLFSKEDFKAALDGDVFYVAESDGAVIGVMGLEYRHIETPAHVTRDIVFIDSMAVYEPYRGHGIGHAFFGKVKEIATQKKADGIELQVNAKNKQAYEMYAKYGFTEKSINLELLQW